MNTVIPLTPPLLRIGLVAIGSLLLWFGSSQISVTGLMLMFLGLATLVRAVSAPRLSLRLITPPLTLTRVIPRSWR